MTEAKVSTGLVQVGIRYCGGCNPRYDRGTMVKRIAAKHPEWAVENAREGNRYDLLLVIGGCSACCAAYEQFTADRVVKLWTDLDDIPAEKIAADWAHNIP